MSHIDRIVYSVLQPLSNISFTGAHSVSSSLFKGGCRLDVVARSRVWQVLCPLALVLRPLPASVLDSAPLALVAGRLKQTVHLQAVLSWLAG